MSSESEVAELKTRIAKLEQDLDRETKDRKKADEALVVAQRLGIEYKKENEATQAFLVQVLDFLRKSAREKFGDQPGGAVFGNRPL